MVRSLLDDFAGSGMKIRGRNANTPKKGKRGTLLNKLIIARAIKKVGAPLGVVSCNRCCIHEVKVLANPEVSSTEE
jgi:hypothetical protein